MPLPVLIALTMLAFAANSVLTRIAVDAGWMAPFGFAVVRIAAGAGVLALIVVLRGQRWPKINRLRTVGALSLTLYVAGFTVAYMTLDAGLGALILFGVVQITMFIHGAVTAQPPSLRQLCGAMIAFLGLALVLWPGDGAVADPFGAILMVLAGTGWAAYTIAGRSAADPLATTAQHFLLCLPVLLGLIGLLFAAGQVSLSISLPGVLLAVICGGVTSGLGYALWYHVLPQIAAANAAIIQLSVPIIAICIGSAFLGEVVGWTIVVASCLVVGGIGWALTAKPAST